VPIVRIVYVILTLFSDAITLHVHVLGRPNSKYLRKYMLTNQIVDKLNALPDRCMECTTLTDFKAKKAENYTPFGAGNTSIMQC